MSGIDGTTEEPYGGRLKPLVLWPESRLTTLIGHGLGYTHYSQLPSPALSNYGCFMTPLCYLLFFDLYADFSPLHVRHGVKEGSVLRAFRSSCRRFFGMQNEDLEQDFREMALLYLAYCTKTPVSDDRIDALVEDALVVHYRMTKNHRWPWTEEECNESIFQALKLTSPVQSQAMWLGEHGK